MSSERGNRRPPQLNVPADAREVATRFDIDRYPLSYLPKSPLSINFARLPDAQQLDGMELAYREKSLPDPFDERFAPGRILPVWILLILATLGSLFAAALLPFVVRLELGALCSAVWLVYRAFKRRVGLRTILAAVAVPTLVITAIQIAAFLLAHRAAAALIFALPTFAIFVAFGSEPFQFYRDWLSTEPRLKPKTRRNLPNNSVYPNLFLLAAILIISVVLPAFSTSIALAVLIVVGLVVCARPGIWRLAELSASVLTEYTEYGRRPSGAPGIWYPKSSCWSRRATTFLLGAALYAPLTLGLCYFLPWDAFRSNFYDVFEKMVFSSHDQGHVPKWVGPAQTWVVQQLLPDIDLTKLPVPPIEKSASRLPEDRLPATPLYGDKAARDRYDADLARAMRLYTAQLHEDYEQRVAVHRPQRNKVLDDLLGDRPHIGIVLALYAMMTGEFVYGWAFVASIGLAFLVTNLLLLAIYRKPLLDAEALRRRLAGDATTPALDEDDRTEWEWYVDRLRTSAHEAIDPFGKRVREAEHLFLGVEPHFRYPVLLNKDVLAEHAYFVGETGSGKTSLGIAPILIQLIRGHATEKGALTPPPPIVILDLKGDPALFHTVRHEVEARRAELGITDAHDPRFAFRFFTSEVGRATHYFNPFQSLGGSSRSLIQMCHLLLDSLGLSHGDGYGRSYYSRKNRYLLYEALSKLPYPESFEELYARILELAQQGPTQFRDVYRDCFELIATIHALTKYPQVATLQPLKRPEDAIHMPSVLEHSQIVYFWLPAALESISVREIAKLSLFSLLTAAIDRQTERQGLKQAYLVIDEFQRIAGENFKIILEQARGFGISAILANQTQADLKTHDIDLRPTIRANTRYKQYFALGDPAEISDLMRASGEELMRLNSWITKSEDWADNQKPRIRPLEAFTEKTSSETVKTRLTVNDIMAVSDHPLHSIVQISRGSGYTQFGGVPILLCGSWPIPEDVYRRRRDDQPWPSRGDYELDVTVPEQRDAQIEHEREIEREETLAKLDEAIQALAAEREFTPD